MIEKELKIRDICGYYALDIPNYNGEILDIIENFPAEESASIKGE